MEFVFGLITFLIIVFAILYLFFNTVQTFIYKKLFKKWFKEQTKSKSSLDNSIERK